MQDRDSRAKLIHRYLDDSLGAEEEAEFVASLENSADTRRQFVDEAFLNHDLREAMREADIRSFIVSGEDEASPEPADKRRQNAPRRRYSIALRSGLAAAVLDRCRTFDSSTCFEGRSAEQRSHQMQLPSPVRLRRNEVNARAVESVGTVVQQRDCKWAEGSTSWRNGDLLPPKTILSLQSGAAEVALENGVRLVLSGPCKVQLVNEMRGRIFRGSLIAKVPSSCPRLYAHDPFVEGDRPRY